MRLIPLLLMSVILFGCTDQLLSNQGGDSSQPNFQASEAAREGKLRNAHLAPQAKSRGEVAGKWGDEDQTHLFLAFNTLEKDGVTRRVLDEWGVTKRILQEYGVSRRVLESYGLDLATLEAQGVTRRVLDAYQATVSALEAMGITRRILSEYAGPLDDAFLAQFGLTVSGLNDQGLDGEALESYSVTRRVLETYGVSPEELQNAVDKTISSIKLKVRIQKGVPGITIKVKDADLEAFLLEILSDPDILFVEPDFELSGQPLLREEKGRGNDQVVPWNIEQIGTQATDYDNSRVEVYLLDSGVEEYDLNVVERKDFTMLFSNRDQALFDDDFFEPLPYFDPGDSGNPADGTGHGTHIAGTIGAKDNKEGVVGVAPGARIHSLKVLTEEGRTDVTTVISAIDYVIHAKLQDPAVPMVMNLSFGQDTGTTANSVVDDAVRRAIAAGIVVVVSAGNDAADASTYSPAHVDAAITVGAHTQGHEVAGFSNYGSVVDLFAPGDIIVSLSSDPADNGDHGISSLESGTSMAAPHVTGAAAQYLALNPRATPAEVHQALIDGAESDIAISRPGTTNRRAYLGNLARTPDGDKPFDAGTAEWKKSSDGGGTLELKGEGRRADPAVFRDADSGQVLAKVYVKADAKWDIDIKTLTVPPCRVEVEQYGQKAVIPVTEGRGDAPVCSSSTTSTPSTSPTQSGQVSITKAVWKADGRGAGFEVKAEGPKNADVVISYGQSGDILASGQFGGRGSDFSFKLETSNVALVPCTVSVAAVGEVVTMAVQDAPANCRQ